MDIRGLDISIKATNRGKSQTIKTEKHIEKERRKEGNNGDDTEPKALPNVNIDRGRFVYIQTGFPKGVIRIPVASNYDLDNDYDYIMSRALKSYRQHREKEKADTRKGPLRNSHARRSHLRPKTAPPARFVQSMRAQTIDSGSMPATESVFIPKVDAIQEVHRANALEENERSPRRVLQVAKVSVKMLQDESKKAKSFNKRNQPAHPWFSHSYPSVKPLEKFVRPPHCYMSASVGERDLNSALSTSSGASSRSSSAKSSPNHRAGCRPGSANSKSNYFYDGGLFTHPKHCSNDYFVIHPDWVSESMTIQKLSLTDRTKVLPVTKSKSMTWPGRRCNSAPPPKYRNPITWETVDGNKTG